MAYFTILREPVAHIISEFYWTRGLNAHQIKEEELLESLRDYVEVFDHLNHQTYELATLAMNRSNMNAHADPEQLVGSPEALLPQALRNLEKLFLFVGQTENVEETHHFLEERFGFIDLNNAAHGFTNASVAPLRHGVDRRSGIPRDIIELIEKKTEIDRILYEAKGFVNRKDRSSIRSEDKSLIEQYVCKINVPWNYFLQGLIAVGAKFSAGEQTNVYGGTSWRISFNLPVDVPPGMTLICKINLTPYLHDAGVSNGVLVKVKVGDSGKSFSYQIGRGFRESTIALPIRSEDRRSGIIPFDIEIQSVSEIIEEQGRSFNPNPIPFMIQSILLTEMPSLDIESRVEFGLGGTGVNALASGFGEPQAEGLSWSISRTSRLMFQISQRSLIALRADAYAGGNSNIGVEMLIDPLRVPESGVLGQRVTISVPNHQSRSTLLPESKLVTIVVPVEALPNYPGIICLDFVFPDAIPLSEVIEHPDRVNPHSCMFYNLRLVRLLDLGQRSSVDI
ncbi:hypothetical protein [Sphingomonas vulcanisoli]|uniref:hypothetical protein n=1 Tax=Sphingomonas vulcanisoli TaxID=1658060 RepID=UPI001421469F|nr:hypothetical protein [Sphingomonas vulcanisoli]